MRRSALFVGLSGWVAVREGWFIVWRGGITGFGHLVKFWWILVFWGFGGEEEADLLEFVGYSPEVDDGCSECG